MFEDRHDAGSQLAQSLIEANIDADVVLAIPRGGLPLGRIVADALEVPLDIVVAKKIGAPGNPELAIGAVASDGSLWMNDDIIDRLGVDAEYIETSRTRESQAATEKAGRYRSGSDPVDIEGKRVVVVDDGVATGATTRACLRAVRNIGAESVTLAIPVGPAETIERLRGETDHLICVETPTIFGSVGQFYRRFDQVSDRKAMEFLNDG